MSKNLFDLTNLPRGELVVRTLTGDESTTLFWRPSFAGEIGGGAPFDSRDDMSQRESQTSSAADPVSPAQPISSDKDYCEASIGSCSTVYQWGRADTLLLLNLYREYTDEFEDSKTKKIRVWEKVASALQRQGYNVSALQCSNRWKTLKALGRRTSDHNKKTGLLEHSYYMLDIL
ncbi:uncharacterized protein LOC134190626 [Corticium candelabrum]|uniref:uncharacterized protein LOC134190626 n=1 Tax=Corticium candelabrum TaxID=121492 RepID=UPI002E26A587|nr:uncharacterized protein LOC134190626 [Corticium candelabrum]